MNKHIEVLKKEWEKREQRLGKSKKAVLFKRFPKWLNNYIHKQHVEFIISNIPKNARNMLDVGCGYGRISREVNKYLSNIELIGIDLCTEFSAAYQYEFGYCFNGPVQEFNPDKNYDAIVVVTLLMYLSKEEQIDLIRKLYGILSPGGVIIYIEPALEFQVLWRKITGRTHASPTGGNVTYFTKKGLRNIVTNFDMLRVSDEKSVNLAVDSLVLHHCISIVKE